MRWSGFGLTMLVMQQYHVQVIHMAPLPMVKLPVQISASGVLLSTGNLNNIGLPAGTQDFSPNFSEQMDGNGPFWHIL